jgi:O-antigen biosynthesis protein
MAQESPSPLYRLLQRRHTHAGYQRVSRAVKTMIGKEAFYRWRHRLRFAESYTRIRGPVPTLIHADDSQDTRPRMLVIGRTIPTPDRDSGSLRMLRMLSMIAHNGWRVTFIPMDLEYAPGYAEQLYEQGISVLYRPQLYSLEGYIEKHAAQYDCILLSMLETASCFLPLIRRYAPDVRIIFDTVDLHFLRMERKAALEKDGMAQTLAAECKKEELACIREADCTIVVSDEEQKLVAELEPSATVIVLSNIHDVHPAVTSFDERSRILFLGNFQHTPNHDAAMFLIHEIWPLVLQSLPDAHLSIAGHGSDEHAALLQQKSVDVLGHVVDLDALLEETRVCVAPLRYGAGVKGKINMSLSRGVPVVTTSIGAEGMHMIDETHCLIADDPRSFADAIIRLYTNGDLWQKLSNSGSALIEAHFSMRTALQQWKKIERHIIPQVNE